VGTHANYSNIEWIIAVFQDSSHFISAMGFRQTFETPGILSRGALNPDIRIV